MSLLYTIIGFFSLGALIGMYLLTLVLQNKETPKFIAFIHGAFGAIGLILIIYYAMNNGPGLAETIVLFVLAAMGGAVLITKDLSGKPVPKWLAVVHGLLAVTGFIFLLVFTFSK